MRANGRNGFSRIRYGSRWKCLPLVVIVAGSLLSFTVFFMIVIREKASLQTEFRREADNHTAALEESIRDKLLILNSIVHFYENSVSVERQEFSDFVMGVLRPSAMDTLAWVPRVTDLQRNQFEKKAAIEGLNDFSIYELDEEGEPITAGIRDEYFPIYYLSPDLTLQKEFGQLFGYDFGAIASSIALMNYSIDTGKPSLSEMVTLPTNKNKFGFLVFLPIYKTGTSIDSVQERRKNLDGFVVGLISIKEFIEESLGLVSTRGVEIQLFDLDSDNQESFIYEYIPEQSAESEPHHKADMEHWNSDFQYKKNLTVANRKWVIKSYPTPALVSLFKTSESSWGLLITGHILTLFVAGYMIITAKRTAAIERLVQLRTNELNTELNEHKLTEEALRGSELQLSSLVENIPGAVFRCEVHPPWKMTHISNAVAEISGYPAGDFIDGKINIAEIIIPSDYRMVEELVSKCVKNKTPHILEYGIYHADGSIRYVYERGNGVYGKDGEVIYIDGVIVDITDHRKNEEEREHLLRTIETKNKELQSIVYIASHDLRSPLVNIMGFSDELKICCEELKGLLTSGTLADSEDKQIEELLEKSIPQALSFISSGTNNINMLINGLLQVSRAGSVKIDIKSVDMNEAIKNVVENVSFHARELGADITIEDLPPCIADEPMANQVFSNLIGNALKYLDRERKGKITVTGKIEGSNCVYCVSDNGIGIPVQCIEKVFEIFHRLNPGDTEGGEGLGLTIISRILDRLNGSIRVESEFGLGSKFFVILPKG